MELDGRIGTGPAAPNDTGPGPPLVEPAPSGPGTGSEYSSVMVERRACQRRQSGGGGGTMARTGPGRGVSASRRCGPRPGAAHPAQRSAGRGDHPGGLLGPVEPPREVRRPAGHAAVVPVGADPREVGRLRALGDVPSQAGGANLPRDGDRRVRHRPRGVGHGCRPNRSRRRSEALPDDLRQPIELAYFGGHTYREVAQMLRRNPRER